METFGFRKCAAVEAKLLGGSGGGARLAPPQNLVDTIGFIERRAKAGESR